MKFVPLRIPIHMNPYGIWANMCPKPYTFIRDESPNQPETTQNHMEPELIWAKKHMNLLQSGPMLPLKPYDLIWSFGTCITKPYEFKLIWAHICAPSHMNWYGNWAHIKCQKHMNSYEIRAHMIPCTHECLRNLRPYDPKAIGVHMESGPIWAQCHMNFHTINTHIGPKPCELLWYLGPYGPRTKRIYMESGNMAVQNHMDPICHVCSECLETPFVRMLRFPSFRKPDIKLPDSPEKAQFFYMRLLKIHSIGRRKGSPTTWKHQTWDPRRMHIKM